MPEMEMEAPECPVCLQGYDEKEIVPRVLSCGHSVCESCILKLPLRFHCSFSCPACTCLVRLPNKSQGPSSLPKNIDLLRVSSSFPPSKKPQNKETPKALKYSSSAGEFFFPHRLWSTEFYSKWKPWILPRDSISLPSPKNGDFSSSFDEAVAVLNAVTSASVTANSSCPLHFRGNQRVSLLPVAFSPGKDDCFSLSYTARILECLYRMGGDERNELDFISRASLRGDRISRFYGLWMDLENGVLFLVCERAIRDLSKTMRDNFKNGVFGSADEVKKSAIYGFAVMGLELCQVLMGLHSEGLNVGFLSPSCIGLDIFNSLCVDLNGVLALGRRVRKISMASTVGFSGKDDCCINHAVFSDQLMKSSAFVSPEILMLLHNKRATAQEQRAENFDGCGSDIWSLASIMVRLLLGEERFNVESLKTFYSHVLTNKEQNYDKLKQLYNVWADKVISILESLTGANEILVRILSQCLNYEPRCRPHVSEMWKCIRKLLIKPESDTLDFDTSVDKESVIYCLILGELSWPRKFGNESHWRHIGDHHKCDDILRNISGLDLHGRNDGKGLASEDRVDSSIARGLQVCESKYVTLQGHRDCITGLAIGGRFLFSSSFDKTVSVWSLQDFSHVQCLEGHEHRVMAVLALDVGNLLCVSGDSGGGIFVWSIGVSPGKELLKSWKEHSDWRYSGVHSLAVSGTGYLYSGSGDRSIKAWSLQDYSLICTMNGHKSVVSSLAVCNGILYSGSWDGTVRLWWLSDHSPFVILENESPGNIASILSLSVDNHMLVAGLENGYMKMWKNDVLVSSKQASDGAIFALEKVGNWLFAGGWNKRVEIQEISEDEFQVDMQPIGSIACNSIVTALCYWHGRVFVGLADKTIKVYHCKPWLQEV